MAKKRNSWNVKIYDLLFKNLYNKSAALLLAVIIWVYAYGNTGGTESFSAILAISLKNNDKVAIREIVTFPGNVTCDPLKIDFKLKLKDQLRELGRLREMQPFAGRIELNEDQAGEVTILIKDLKNFENLSGRGSRLESADIQKIVVQLESIETRSIPVNTPEVIGQPNLRFRQKVQEIAELEAVEVRGPVSLLDKVELIIDPISIEGIGVANPKAFERLVQFKEDIPGVNWVGLKPSTRLVRVRLEENTETRNFKVPILVATRAEDMAKFAKLKMDPRSEVQITFDGPKEQLDQLKKSLDAKEFFVFWIPGDWDFKPGSLVLSDLDIPRDKLPEGVRAINLTNSKSIEVFLEK